jgi:hypothetical protein
MSEYTDGLWARRPGFDSQQGQEISLFSTESRPALGTTQPVPEVLSLAVKWPERESDRSPQPSVGVENGGVIPQLPHTSSWYSA